MTCDRVVSVSSALPPDVEGTAVTVGTFDGVHRGHQNVLARLTERASATGLASLLVTFEPHPLAIVNPGGAPRLLTVGDEKLEVLATTGLQYLAVLPFTRTLASYGAATFVDEILRGRFRMRELLIGHDHGFGRGREGDVDLLRSLGGVRDFRVAVIPPVPAGDGGPVSSTRIREAVTRGDLATAAAALGRAYSANGRVMRGDQRGRTLGFPTLNISLPSLHKLLPPDGVYAVRVATPDGTFGGMANLGARPTFGDERMGLEAHLFDADGDWYDAHVRLAFVARLRDNVRFSDPRSLVAQLRHDAEAARRALTAN
ncbi:MAG: bifunctional riboflavin kinase/FAD synthetase [Gemmatimonadaceae bacterium]